MKYTVTVSRHVWQDQTVEIETDLDPETDAFEDLCLERTEGGNWETDEITSYFVDYTKA